MKKILSTAGILFFILLFMAGCGPSYVVVGTRPVAPVYARPIAPGPNYIWVEGEWIRSGRGYVYNRGYWAPPRARYHRYIPGHWQQRRNGWFWVRGRWN